MAIVSMAKQKSLWDTQVGTTELWLSSMERRTQSMFLHQDFPLLGCLFPSLSSGWSL
jgi:hypothetical protein